MTKYIRSISFRAATPDEIASENESVSFIETPGHEMPTEHGPGSGGTGPPGGFDGIYYVGFDWSCDANGCDRTLNGFTSFPPSIMEFLTDSDFGFEGQTFNMDRVGATNVYKFAIGFTNGGGREVGPQIVGGTTYHIDLLFDGLDFVTIKIDGVDVGGGPVDTSGIFNFDHPPDPWYYRFIMGAGPYNGTSTNYKGIWTYDNLTIGTSGYGSTELFSSDFSTASPSGFDAEVDTASELAVAAGIMTINFAGAGASRNAYLRKDIV